MVEPVGGGQGAKRSPDAFKLGAISILGAKIVIKTLTEYFSKLHTEKLILKLLMHKNNLFSHISPSLNALLNIY